MRFDIKVLFVNKTERAYDSLTGDYLEPVEEYEEAYCDVTNTGTQMAELVYGDVTHQSLTVRSRLWSKAKDVIIAGKRYHVSFKRKLKRISTYIVEEV